MTNTQEFLDDLTSIIDAWALEHKEKITLQHVQELYPVYDGNTTDCDAHRLRIPKLLYMEEAIIYVDTNVIFMRPPEDLWKHFHNFDSIQFASTGSYHRQEATNKASMEKTPLRIIIYLHYTDVYQNLTI